MTRRVRVFHDWHTDEWITQGEWVRRYERPSIHSALHYGYFPRHVHAVKDPAPFGRTATPKHRGPLVHRIEIAIEGHDGGRECNAARYVCGETSVDLMQLDEPGDLRKCGKCFPPEPGEMTWSVYGYWNAAGDALYVGQTSDLAKRRKSHSKRAPWFGQSYWHDVISTHATRAEALAAERAAIQRMAPLFNIQHNPKAVAA